MNNKNNHNILVNDILKVTNGELIVGDTNTICENFCRDTREIQRDDIYIAFKGENVNGAIYFEEAFKKGAKGCIVQDIEISDEQKEKYKDKFIIKVNNTIKAIQEVAKYKRSLYNIPVVAITGSVGKTSTKDMIASIVSKKYNTLKTEGNYNNHIGVPLTILRLKEHEAAVIEMGMNHLGEIRTLTKIAKPTIAVITNVGTAHIGNLGSRENILTAKLEILEGLIDNGNIIINNDNDLLHDWNEKNKDKKVVTFGIQNKSDYMAENIISNEIESTYNLNGNEKIRVPVGGNHFVLNSLCGISIGKVLGIEMKDIIKGIETFELTKKRMDITKLKNEVTIINDCYNANYDSMKAALEYLGNIKEKRKIAVLGDMLELGEYSKKLHEDVGIEVQKNNIDILIIVGKEARSIAKTAEEKGFEKQNIYVLNNNTQAIEKINSIMKKNDYILFKASNGMHFEEIIKGIEIIC